MQRLRILIPTFLILLIATPLFATTYYVATPLDGGSDSNNGTAVLTPFATINKAVSVVAPGDTVNVRRGTYIERVLIWGKGSSTGWITFQKYASDTETPVIDGTGSSGNGVVAIGGGSTYIRFDGFEVKSGPNHGIFLYDASYIDVLNNKVHDCMDGGIIVRSASASALGTTQHVLVQGNTVYHDVLNNATRTASSWQQAVSAYRATYVQFIDNEVYENYGEGIDMILSDHGEILGNTVRDNFSVNIYLDNAATTIVDHNHSSCGNSAYYRGTDPAGGIVAADEHYSDNIQLSGLTVTNNLVRGCKAGFEYGNWEDNGGLHSSTIANNVFYSTTYATIWMQGGNVHSNVLVANNILYQTANKVYASSTGTSGVTYQYNCWYGGGDTSTIITGSGDVTTDPKLYNPGGTAVTDYQLTTGSSCIDTGTTAAGVTEDYWGTSRPSGNGIDIGLHEL